MVKWFGTNTDIHEQKQLQQQKDDFVNIASHEFKTPLTSAKAYMQLIQKKSNDENLTRFAISGLEQLNRLERLTADLLDVTRINAGKLQYENTTFNFRDLLIDCISSIQQTTSSHLLVIEETVNFSINGDRHRIEQIINNLVNNAVKYSPGADKVIIRSRVVHNNLVVSIQDFGVGIAEEQLTNLFDRFYRIEDTAMRFQGLGLGLFIASEILQRHNGKFWIESLLDKGSTFYFMLQPLKESGFSVKVVDEEYKFFNEHISIEFLNKENMLLVDWKGFQNFKTVTDGGMKILKILKTSKTAKVLNDNSNVLGSWSEASDWAREVWFPMMEKAGLTHFAWVYSKSTFSQLSANKSVDILNGNVTVRLFNSMAKAIHWLKDVDNGKS